MGEECGREDAESAEKNVVATVLIDARIALLNESIGEFIATWRRRVRVGVKRGRTRAIA
jgi:hypothetical protein